MKVFIVFYLTIMFIFHSLAFILTEENDQWDYTMKFLGGLTLIIYQVMFFSFVKRIRVLWEIVDDYYFYKHEGKQRHKLILCCRWTLVTLWYFMFTLDSIFMTFMRPAGSVYFMHRNLEDYANNLKDSLALLRVWLQINQNISVFINGMFVIRAFSFFG